MKGKKRIVLSVILALIMLASLFAVPVNAADKNTSNRYNVCFVLDSTDSLKKTDEEKLRYDATNMFLGLLANDGNYVGSVIFSGGIIKTTDVTPISGMDDKTKAETDLETSEQRGATTIGAALDQAVDMLLEKGDKSLPSVVILLSDGQSDKSDKNEMNSRSDALAKAKSNNIPVYTVALNADGQADLDVLEQIAKATNGEYKVVEKADDLKDIFKEFYNMIYSSGTTTIIDGTIPADGKISVDFDVPSRGVEEVNIIISSDTKLKNIILIPPSGIKMTDAEVQKITTSGKRFSITKLTSPEGGKWTLNGEGTPNSKIKIDMIINDKITVETKYESKDMYGLNDSVVVTGYVLDDGENITASEYEEYTAKLIPDTDNGSEIPMSISGNSFSATITFDEEGTYAYHMYVEGDGKQKSTDESEILLNVGNRAPVLNEDIEEIKEHFWVFPFFTKTCEVDLSDIATDPDGDSLTYEVTSSTFKDTTYEIDGNKLVITDFYDLSKGVSTVKISDPQGAYVERDVTVSLTNVGILALIIIGGGGLIILILLYLKIRHDLLLKFSGTIKVAPEGEASVAMSSQTPIRGRCRLSSFGVSLPGLDATKCYFQATGKDHVFLIAKKKVYISGSSIPVKKIRINGDGSEMLVMAQNNSESGLYISFESLLNNYF